MNPFYLAAIALAIATASGAAGYARGRGDGADHQKATDQVAFDQVNAERARQVAVAGELERRLGLELVAKQHADAERNRALEMQSAKLNEANDALRVALAPGRLRYSAPAEGGACRPGRAGAESAASSPAGAPAPAIVQLPDAIAGDLRQLAFEADRLGVEYRKCYAFATAGEVSE